MTTEDLMMPQDPEWPATPLFFPAVLPVSVNLANFKSRYLGLIPDQENYHDLIESVFESMEEVFYDEDQEDSNNEAQELRYYKPNIALVSKQEARKLFSVFNTRKDHIDSLTPFLLLKNNLKKRKNSENA